MQEEKERKKREKEEAKRAKKEGKQALYADPEPEGDGGDGDQKPTDDEDGAPSEITASPRTVASGDPPPSAAAKGAHDPPPHTHAPARRSVCRSGRFGRAPASLCAPGQRPSGKADLGFVGVAWGCVCLCC